MPFPPGLLLSVTVSLSVTVCVCQCVPVGERLHAFVCMFQVQKLMRMSEQNECFDRDRDCSLFVFHLPPDWDDEDLKKKFSGYGSVVASKVSLKEDGSSRGYGFVTCSDPRSTALAILNLNGLEICSKRLKVKPKQTASTSHPKTDSTVFVFHLPNEWTDTTLTQVNLSM